MLTRRTLLQSALLLPTALTYPVRAQQAATGTVPAKAAPAIEVFANFESGSYDGWTIEGNAFGSAPTTDALFPGQISGFTERGFLCSLHPRRGTPPPAKPFPVSSPSKSRSLPSRSAVAIIPMKPA